MTTSVKPIPEGFHTVTPYLIQRDAKRGNLRSSHKMRLSGVVC